VVSHIPESIIVDTDAEGAEDGCWMVAISVAVFLAVVKYLVSDA
jgi:hypothetical protein